jgi:hypothetical protein
MVEPLIAEVFTGVTFAVTFPVGVRTGVPFPAGVVAVVFVWFVGGVVVHPAVTSIAAASRASRASKRDPVRMYVQLVYQY